MKLRSKLRVDPDKFRLADCDPDDTGSYDKKAALRVQAKNVLELESLQERLFAESQRALLLVLQSTDTGGKDGTIKHVLSGVNPQGVDVHSFKAPNDEALKHGYLWRIHRVLPERGRIGIFNRSYYEEVLVVRVHPELLKEQHSIPGVDTSHPWRQRYEDIVNFERYLENNGTRVVKVFLHISKEEQRKRLLARLDDPSKHWKFSPDDVRERTHWSDYQHAFERMLQATSSDHAPWYVVPANHKWFAHAAVSTILVEELKALDPKYPHVPKSLRDDLAAARKKLRAEK